jgi:hypothetical protein
MVSAHWRAREPSNPKNKKHRSKVDKWWRSILGLRPRSFLVGGWCDFMLKGWRRWSLMSIDISNICTCSEACTCWLSFSFHKGTQPTGQSAHIHWSSFSFSGCSKYQCSLESLHRHSGVPFPNLSRCYSSNTLAIKIKQHTISTGNILKL